MASAVIQPSFVGGELSPSAHGRVDLARYMSSLKTCRNFIVRPYGGVVNRPGSYLIVATKDSTKRSRLVPFQFSTEQTYVLEFGNLYMRVIMNGVQVEDGGSPVEIVTPWPEAALSYLKFSQKADVMTVTHPDYPAYQLGRTSHVAWTLTEFAAVEGPFQDVNVNEGITVYASAEEGTVDLVASGDIFTAAMEGSLFRMEAPSFAGIERWEPGKEIAAAGVNPFGKIRAYQGRLYKCITDTVATGGIFRTGSSPPTHLEGTESDGDGEPVQGFTPDIKREGVEWEYISDLYGIVRIDSVTDARNAEGVVMRRMPLVLVGGATAPEIVTNGTFATNIAGWNNYSAGGSIAWQSGKLLLLAAGGGTAVAEQELTTQLSRRYRVQFELSGADVTVNVGSTLHGTQLKTMLFSGATTHSFYFESTGATVVYFEFSTTGNALVDNVSVKLAAGYTPTYKWAKAAWSAEQGYPGASAYHQQRQIFAAARQAPQHMWLSRGGGAYKNFGRGIPVLDDDGITYKLDSTQVNEIRHIVPGGAGFLALTSGGVWELRGTQDGAITPDSVYAILQDNSGVSHVAPLSIGTSVLFLHDKGSVVADLGYSLERDSYSGKDLTVLSDHLFFGREITDWAFQKVPFRCAWAVRDDGILLGLTFLPEQEVFAWHRHDSRGFFESVCCVSEGGADALYAIVRRTLAAGAQRLIERFDPRTFTDPKDAYFVDCGLSTNGWNVAATTLTLSGGTAWDHTEELTLTASGATFSAGSVGDQVFLRIQAVVTPDTVPPAPTLRKFDVIGYTSSTVVTVRPVRAVPASMRGVALTDWALAFKTFSGLDHLNGETVSVLADGNVCPQVVVASGAITVPYHAAVVHAGLPYVSDLETLDLVVSGEQIRGKSLLIPRVSLIVEASRGIWVGPDADHLTEYKQRATEPYDDPVAPVSGLIGPIAIGASWNRNGRIFLRQSDPLPLSVLAVIPEVVAGG